MKRTPATFESVGYFVVRKKLRRLSAAVDISTYCQFHFEQMFSLLFGFAHIPVDSISEANRIIVSKKQLYFSA